MASNAETVSIWWRHHESHDFPHYQSFLGNVFHPHLGPLLVWRGFTVVYVNFKFASAMNMNSPWILPLKCGPLKTQPIFSSAYNKISTSLYVYYTSVFMQCQIYCYGRYCVRRSVSPQVPENPSGPLVDNFIVLPCVAFGVTCVKLLPGVDRWNSLDEPRVIGPCHCEVWGWPRH